MANVAHNILTGADLHEPKGISTAANNTVYVANGFGTGTWASGAVLLGITGQIADFANPVAPLGWLECDGSTQSRATFAALFAAQTIQQTGTRTNSSPIITGLTSTTNMRIGYQVGGAGITNGTTVLTVDSPTQITMSANAISTGSSTVIVSPWLLGDGSTTFNLPDLSTGARYRRSRNNANRLGVFQTDATKVFSHTHTYSGSSTTGSQNANHTHSGTTATSSATGYDLDHTHNYEDHFFSASNSTSPGGNPPGGGDSSTTRTSGSANSSLNHAHSFGTGSESASHQHGFSWSGTTAVPNTTGDTETRPITLIVLTCIKT